MAIDSLRYSVINRKVEAILAYVILATLRQHDDFYFFTISFQYSSSAFTIATPSYDKHHFKKMDEREAQLCDFCAQFGVGISFI